MNTVIKELLTKDFAEKSRLSRQQMMAIFARNRNGNGAGSLPPKPPPPPPSSKTADKSDSGKSLNVSHSSIFAQVRNKYYPPHFTPANQKSIVKSLNFSMKHGGKISPASLAALKNKIGSLKGLRKPKK